MQKQFKVLPASQGWQWLMQAGDLIGRYRSAFLLLAVTWAAVSFIRVVPFIGTIVLLLLTPGLQAGVMYAFGRAVRRQAPEPGNLFTFLQGANRPAMLQMGIIVLLGLLLTMIFISFITLGLLPDLMQVENIDQLALEDLPLVRIWFLLAIILSALTLLGLALFFALPRVAFDDIEPAAALLESFRACLQNWRAMLMFGVAQVIVSVAGALMMVLVLSVIGIIGGAIAQLLENLLLSIFLMFLQVLVCGGQYLAWRDIFGDSDKQQDTQAPTDNDQLIA